MLHILITFKDRLFTALLAPIIFNLGVFITALALRLHRDNLAFNLPHGSGTILLFAGIAIPAIVGFFMGSQSFGMLLGHFFYSNMDHQKSIRKTLLCWLGFLLINVLFITSMT